MRENYLIAIKALSEGMGYEYRLEKDCIVIEFAPISNDTFQEIIDHLNETTSSSFRLSKATRLLIERLLRDDYTRDDFFSVIDSKSLEWKNDDKMKKYLRPSTLFNFNKFENYAVDAASTPKATMFDLLKDEWGDNE